MNKMCTDFIKCCIIVLSMITSCAFQETIEISPTSASRIEAFHNGSCDTYNASFAGDCMFPDLFSEEEGKCKPFNEVECGNRTEPFTPCDYANSNCSRPIANASLCVCDKDQDLNYGMCLSLSDGEYAWPARHWSPYFIQCKSRRTLPSSCEGHSVIYNFFENKCQVVYEVVNAAYNLSLSLNIPESLYHLLSFKPTQFVPLTTQEITPTFLNPTFTSDTVKKSSDFSVESVMFTKTSFETTFSTTAFPATSKSVSYNIIDGSSLHATPPLTYAILSSGKLTSTSESISSSTGIPSANTTSVYQPNASEQISIFSKSKRTSINAAESTSSKSAPTSSDEVSSTKQTEIFSPSTSITNILSTMNVYSSIESKLDPFNVTPSPSSLFNVLTATERILQPVSTNQYRTSMDILSSSELSVTLPSFSTHLNIPSSNTIQTKPLLYSAKQSDSIRQLTTVKLSLSEVHSAIESMIRNNTDSKSSSHLPSSAVLASSEYVGANIKIGTTTDHFNSSPLTSVATTPSLVHSTDEIKLQTTANLVNSSQITIGSTQSSLFLSASRLIMKGSESPIYSSVKTSTSHESLSSSTYTFGDSFTSLKQTSFLTQSTVVSRTTTVNTTDSAILSAKTSTSLKSLSSSTNTFGDSFASLKQTSFLTKSTVVSRTTTVNTTDSAIPSRYPAATQLYSSVLSQQAPEFSSSITQSLLSSATESTVGEIVSTNTDPTSIHTVSKDMMVSSNLASISPTRLTTPDDSIVTTTSITPTTKDSSMQVSITLLSSTSNYNQMRTGIKSSEIVEHYASDQTLLTSRSLQYESYMMSHSTSVFEQGSSSLHTTSRPESSEYGGSMATESPTLVLSRTVLPSESIHPTNTPKVQIEKLTKVTTSSKLLKASYSLKESFKPTSTGVMGLSATVVSSHKITGGSKVSLSSSRENPNRLKTSMYPVSSSDYTKSSVKQTSDFDYTLKQTISVSSENINTLKTKASFKSDNSVLPEGLTTSIKPSKSRTEYLTKSMTSFQSIASSEIPPVLIPHEHSTIKPPHQVTPTTGTPSDNSAERQKNTRTSIAIGVGVGGGIVLICIIILVVTIVLRKKNKKGRRDFFQVRLPPELFMSRSL